MMAYRDVAAIASATLIAFVASGCGGATCPAPTPPGIPDCNYFEPIPAPTPAEDPTPAPAPSPGKYWGPPTNPKMQYLAVSNINEIPDFQPECVSSFCDATIGTKMPDSCCDPAAWVKDGKSPATLFPSEPDILYKPDDTSKTPMTCYARVAPGPFNGQAGGKDIQWIRNYIGCEDGKLQAHENCVPGGVQYLTKEQYAAGADTTDCDSGACAWSYPMNKTHGVSTFEDGTGDSCHCSKLSHFKYGPGCYIAFATLAQYAGMYPAVFVKARIHGNAVTSCFACKEKDHLFTLHYRRTQRNDS